MPVLGFGVYQIPAEQTEQAVSDALVAGHRSLDTAAAYRNEEAVGRAIVASGIPRTSPSATTTAPGGRLQELTREGLAKAIGVSNFYPDRLADLIAHNEITPAVNQIETHPFNQRTADQELMREHGVQIESWGPFAEGQNNIFSDPVLSEIGAAHGKSVAQVVLRWLIQRDVIVIPKSVRPERMRENIDVFDFELTDDQMARIAGLDTGGTLFFDHADPEWVTRLNSVRVD
jgi:2,5-diketo-D-gluconate reductase A